MQEKLSIKVEISALEIQEDGFLDGGLYVQTAAAKAAGVGAPSSASSSSDQDVFDCLSTRNKAGQSLGITIGPDTWGTLSFTSGSTGLPKGVQGRHFALSHYYPFMGRRFGLNENDRFTMLSGQCKGMLSVMVNLSVSDAVCMCVRVGIAHDPIQRDIFTPIFFGASLYVPTANDIAVPGRLARWMAKAKVNISHLTPAMAQLLCAHTAVSGEGVPSLRYAFLVGDILTKRDAAALQRLAQNCGVVNMYGESNMHARTHKYTYEFQPIRRCSNIIPSLIRSYFLCSSGTTETQRAVSHFVLPAISSNPTALASVKDILPAGKG